MTIQVQAGPTLDLRAGPQRPSSLPQSMALEARGLAKTAGSVARPVPRAQVPGRDGLVTR